MAGVVLDGVNKVYPNGFQAIHDLSIDIADGEFLVLVGPSGCGKSTALRMVAGLEDISSGELRIGDRVVNEVPPKDRDIAMVFQNYALYPHMTVSDNIGLRAQARRRSPRPRSRNGWARAAEILGLTEYLRPQAWPAVRRPAPAGRHGPGHRARAGGLPHGRAALEPRRQAAGARRGPRSSRCSSSLGVTTIYVTHDQVEAMTMGDRVGGAAAAATSSRWTRPSTSTTIPTTPSWRGSSVRRP